MNCVSCDICVHHLWFVSVFFPWGIPQLQSDWSLSCDHGLDNASKCENNNSNNNNTTTTAAATTIITRGHVKKIRSLVGDGNKPPPPNKIRR